jgi:transposase
VTPEELFAMALGLSRPWFVASSLITQGELHIRIDFEPGAKFDGRPVHDTLEREWRHLNFWQYPTYLHARIPRVIGEDGKVTLVDVPWARPGSGFTALFEAIVLAMARSMPVSEVARNLKVDDMAIWRLLEGAVASAREKADYSKVTRVGLDETATKRGHHYITKFVDLDASRVLFVCQGKGADTLEEFKRDLVAHGGDPEKVTTISCDMSPAFLSGAAQRFPKARVVLDRFHLMKMVSEAVDATRREETGKTRRAKGTRFLLLKNPSKLSVEQRELLGNVLADEAFAKTSEAYRLRLAFQELFRQKKSKADHYLATWLDAALDSGVKAMEDVAETFFKMRDKILAWFDDRVSNGILEGFNSVLQSAKSRARGYANPKHMILMSYLLHGKLDLSPSALQKKRRLRLMST